MNSFIEVWDRARSYPSGSRERLEFFKARKEYVANAYKVSLYKLMYSMSDILIEQLHSLPTLSMSGAGR